MATEPEVQSAPARARIPSEFFVEVVRLVIVAGCTVAGFQLGGGRGASGVTHLVGACLGAGIGYVHGGVAGRLLRRVLAHFEERVERMSVMSLVGGTAGGVLLGLLALLMGAAAVVLLPPVVGWPLLGLLVWLGMYAGFQVGARKGDELLTVTRGAASTVAAGADGADASAASGLVLVDTSAAIDGRLLALASTGFLPGRLAVARFVLDELQGIADAGDPTRRRRGRRGIETLEALRDDTTVGVETLDEEVPEMEEVDAKLVALARRRGASLLTVDANLCSSAELQGVKCCNIHRLARSLQPVLVPGEVIRLKVSKEGRDEGQGVGFLDDGTMVVVSNGADHVGLDAEVSITSSVQTSRGRMFFASLTA